MAGDAPIGILQTSPDPDGQNIATSPRLLKPWHISDQGLSFVGMWESGVLNGLNWLNQQVTDGFILKVYDDGYGNPTVGLGHKVVPGDGLAIGDTISLERAREFFRVNSEATAHAINHKVMVALHRYEYDAVFSVIFNAGPGDPATELADRLNTGHYEEIPRFLLTFHARSEKIRKRRKTEARLFGQGIYDASH